MTVGEIVKQWLEDHGCDGLCDPDAECGCGIDDLNPCGGLCDDCIPARRVEGEVGRMYVPIEDDQLGPTRQERVERKLRGALNEIVLLADVTPTEISRDVTMLAEYALDWVPENEDMDRAVEDLPGKESDDERVY